MKFVITTVYARYNALERRNALERLEFWEDMEYMAEGITTLWMVGETSM